MEGQDGDKALRRIILMLLALATLAERASVACYPVRCLVLWALRPGEAAASGFVREVVQTPFQVADLPAFPHDNSPDEALRLAVIFRALAAALQHLLRQPRRFMREIRRGDCGGARPIVRHWNGKPLIGRPGSRAPPPDTGRAGRQSSGAGTAVWSVSARLRPGGAARCPYVRLISPPAAPAPGVRGSGWRNA